MDVRNVLFLLFNLFVLGSALSAQAADGPVEAIQDAELEIDEPALSIDEKPDLPDPPLTTAPPPPPKAEAKP